MGKGGGGEYRAVAWRGALPPGIGRAKGEAAAPHAGFPLPRPGALAEAARRWTLALVRRPSVTATVDEASFGPWLAEAIADTPALGEVEIVSIPVPGDRLGRVAVAAILPGASPRALVLTGHYDTVGMADYGALSPLALDPERLAPALLARLEGLPSRDAAEALAFDDLRAGDFLPGRAVLDMKGGLAAGLAVMEAFAAQPLAERPGHLVFLAVPDEETNSAGARAAAPALPALAAARGLELVGAVNLDAVNDPGEGVEGRSVALGTIGKLLPFAFCLGRAVHACYPLQGLNAAALAGAVVAEVEWADGLTDSTPDEPGPPPSCIGLRDSKPAYDVTTPAHVFASFNVNIQRATPADVLDRFEALVARAGRRALADLAARRARASGAEAADAEAPALPVLRFSQLRAEVEASSPEGAARFAEVAEAVAQSGADLPEQARRLTEILVAASGRTGPLVVIGFGSTPYLPTHPGAPDGPGGRFRRAVEAAVRDVEGEGIDGLDRPGPEGAGEDATVRPRIALRTTFTGISDMSFLGDPDERLVEVIARETPSWGFGLAWPEGPAFAGVPIVNAGPWGRDYHTPLERAHAPYLFGTLPRLVEAIARRALAAPEEA